MIDVTFKEIAQVYLSEEEQRKDVYYRIALHELKTFANIQQRLLWLIQKQTLCPLSYEESLEMKFLEEDIEIYWEGKRK